MPIENPNNISVFDKKLKSVFEREQAKLRKETEAKMMEGKEKWVRSFLLPESYQPIAKDVPTKGKETTHFLEKEKWEPAYLLLARTIEDNLVVGKPEFNSYVKPVKVEDKNKTFDGSYAPLKVIN